jgi:hypothetical protein
MMGIRLRASQRHGGAGRLSLIFELSNRRWGVLSVAAALIILERQVTIVELNWNSTIFKMKFKKT